MTPRARRIASCLLASAVLAGCASFADDGTRAAARRRGAALAGHPQSRNLTCESRSGADVLAWHGLAGSEGDVFDRLPRSDNPDRGFVGNPDGPTGGLPPAAYGVHAAPVAAALRALGLDARAEAGRDLAWLAAQTREGRPVIAWVTGSCEPSRAVARTDSAGRPYRAVPGEHTVLVLHVGRRKVLVLDPATGGLREFDVDAFEQAWRLLDGSAVSAAGPIRRPAGAR